VSVCPSGWYCRHRVLHWRGEVIRRPRYSYYTHTHTQSIALYAAVAHKNAGVRLHLYKVLAFSKRLVASTVDLDGYCRSCRSLSRSCYRGILRSGNYSSRPLADHTPPSTNLPQPTLTHLGVCTTTSSRLSRTTTFPGPSIPPQRSHRAGNPIAPPCSCLSCPPKWGSSNLAHRHVGRMSTAVPVCVD
jgi:hypothetical protein